MFLAERGGPNPRCLHASSHALPEGATEESPAKGRRKLFLQLFCALAGLGEECAFLSVYSQWCFLQAPALSSQDPYHRMQYQATVIYRVRKLSQREALEQYGSGSHKLSNFELCLAVSPGKEQHWSGRL